MKIFWKIVIGATLIYFLSWFVLYKAGINTLPLQSEDTLPTVFLPFSILRGDGLYLDEFYPMLLSSYPHPDDKGYEKGLVPFYARRVASPSTCPGGLQPKLDSAHSCSQKSVHYVSAFTILVSLLALPVYLFPVLLHLPITWELIYVLSHLAAALIVAFSGGFMFVLLRKHVFLNKKRSVLLTAVYLFGTINFALVSQSLWQHGAVQLFLILTLLFVYREDFFWAAFMFCLAALSRPTAVFVLPFIIAFTFTSIKKHNLSFLKSIFVAVLGAVLPVLFFFWYNKTFYLGVENQGYYVQLTIGWLSKFPEGFLGIWLSPSKGILVYSPVFFFALVGFYIYIKDKRWKMELSYLWFLLAVLTHTLIMGKWKHWYGGYSYGYRMAADVIPFLILLLVPFVKSPFYNRFKRVFFSTIIFSILVQLFGLVFFDGIWHAAYDDGFENTRWLWSLKDSELSFNIRRILVKFGMLNKACPKCLPR
jgi:hypothetical protein